LVSPSVDQVARVALLLVDLPVVDPRSRSSKQ